MILDRGELPNSHGTTILEPRKTQGEWDSAMVRLPFPAAAAVVDYPGLSGQWGTHGLVEREWALQVGIVDFTAIP